MYHANAALTPRHRLKVARLYLGDTYTTVQVHYINAAICESICYSIRLAIWLNIWPAIRHVLWCAYSPARRAVSTRFSTPDTP